MKTMLLTLLRRALPVVLLGTTLCACQTAYQPGSIKTASISSHFKGSQKMALASRGGTLLSFAAVATGGLAVALAADASMKNSDEAMRQFFVTEMRQALSSELAARGQFQIVPEGQGEGMIEIKSEVWGFYLSRRGSLLSGEATATCYVQATLKDRKGKTLWSAMSPGSNAEMQEMSQSKGHLTKELQANPELMRRELGVAIRRAARQLASRLPLGQPAR